MKVPHLGRRLTTSGICNGVVAYTLVELSALLSEESRTVPPVIQSVLDKFASVFATPSRLPPRCAYDHVIPLIHVTKPVSIIPYCLVPELKYEIEQQVKELLAKGVIQPK